MNALDLDSRAVLRLYDAANSVRRARRHFQNAEETFDAMRAAHERVEARRAEFAGHLGPNWGGHSLDELVEKALEDAAEVWVLTRRPRVGMLTF